MATKNFLYLKEMVKFFLSQTELDVSIEKIARIIVGDSINFMAILNF